MGKKTLIKKRKDMQRRPLPACHGGEGTLSWIAVLDGEDVKQSHLNFLHDDILPPGVSIGVHRHQNDVEYYYIISGKGVMTLDGQRFKVETGDITAVFPGGTHGLENNTDEDLRILVISVS